MDELIEFKKYLLGLQNISNESWNTLSSSVEIKDYSKGEILVAEESVLLKEYFLVKGVVRAYLRSSDGAEKNLRFYTSKGFLGYHIVKRPVNGKISFTYECLTKCSMISLSSNRFLELVNNNTEIKKIAVRAKDEEIRWLDFSDRISIMRNNYEKYHLLKQHFPGLEQNIAQYHIASFLGFSPVTLSRIRGNYT